MTPQSAPVYRSASVLVDALAEDIRFLRNFPEHIEAPELWERVNAARGSPEIFFAALLQVSKEFEAEDDLILHPENCQRCSGSGRFTWQSKPRLCGCPEGERLRRRARSGSEQPDLEYRPLTTRQMFECRPAAKPAFQIPLIPVSPLPPAPTAPAAETLTPPAEHLRGALRQLAARDLHQKRAAG